MINKMEPVAKMILKSFSLGSVFVLVIVIPFSDCRGLLDELNGLGYDARAGDTNKKIAALHNSLEREGLEDNVARIRSRKLLSVNSSEDSDGVIPTRKLAIPNKKATHLLLKHTYKPINKKKNSLTHKHNSAVYGEMHSLDNDIEPKTGKNKKTDVRQRYHNTMKGSYQIIATHATIHIFSGSTTKKKRISTRTTTRRRETTHKREIDSYNSDNSRDRSSHPDITHSTRTHKPSTTTYPTTENKNTKPDAIESNNYDNGDNRNEYTFESTSSSEYPNSDPSKLETNDGEEIKTTASLIQTESITTVKPTRSIEFEPSYENDEFMPYHIQLLDDHPIPNFKMRGKAAALKLDFLSNKLSTRCSTVEALPKLDPNYNPCEIKNDIVDPVPEPVDLLKEKSGEINNNVIQLKDKSEHEDAPKHYIDDE